MMASADQGVAVAAQPRRLRRLDYRDVTIEQLAADLIELETALAESQATAAAYRSLACAALDRLHHTTIQHRRMQEALRRLLDATRAQRRVAV